MNVPFKPEETENDMTNNTFKQQRQGPQQAADGVLSDNEGKDGPRGSEEILGDKKEALNGAGLEKEVSYV